MTAKETAAQWYELFSRYAADLYPNRYSPEHCLALAEQAEEIKALAAAKGSKIAVHNYLLPEFHEIADYLGDSLGLAINVRGSGARRVDFQSVHFMGATAKIILGDRAGRSPAGPPAIVLAMPWTGAASADVPRRIDAPSFSTNFPQFRRSGRFAADILDIFVTA